MAGLQDYRLGRVLGRGSTGVVVEAVHVSLGLLAAVKRLPGRNATREARTIARIDHPNVLTVFDAGETDDGSWFAMERARGPVVSVSDQARWAAVVRGILRGLAAAHAADVLHLDVKPGNVLLLDDGDVALADFGIAALGDRAVPTQGTPGFMAPELRAGHADARSDLYAAGAVAYALLAGWPPDPSGRLQPLPSELDLAPGTFDWLRACLAPDPAQRFQHVADALAAMPEASVAVLAAPALALGPTMPMEPSALGSSGARDAAPPPAPLPDDLPVHRARTGTLAGAGLLGFRRVPFTGRIRELERLWGHLRDVARTGRGLHVGIVGPRGAGTTRLVEEFRRRAWAAGAGRRPGEQRVAVVGEGGAPNTLRVDEDIVHADVVVEVSTLDLGTVRAALVAWTRSDPALVTALADQCGGDLGLAVATVQASLSDGAMAWVGGRLVATRPVSLPAALVRTWDDRLAPVRPGRAHALAVAAAMGHTVDTAWLHEAVGPNDLAETLVRARLACHVPEGMRWASGALRRAVRHDQASLHATLAASVPGDDGEACWRRAVHAWQAGDASVLPTLFERASDQAAKGAMVETEQVLRSVVAETLSDGDRALLYGALAVLGPTHLGYDEAERFAGMALEGTPTDDVQTRASLLTRLAWLSNMRGLPRKARPFVEQALRLDPSTVSGAMNLGYVLIGEGRSRAAELAFGRARERAAALGQTYSISSAAGAEAIAVRYLGRYDEAIEAFRRHRRLLNDAGFHAADADNTMGIADAYRFAGDLDQALVHHLEAVRLAQTGQTRADLGFEVGLALCWRERGDFDRAEALLAGCRARAVDDGPTWNGMITIHWLVARWARGESVGAADLVRAAGLLDRTNYVDPDLPRALRLVAGGDDELAKVARPLCARWEARLEAGHTLDPAQLALLGS